MTDREILAQQWRERLDDFAASQRSVPDWCDFNRVTPDRYDYWRRRWAHTKEPQPQKPCFMAVDLVDTPAVAAAPRPLTLQIAGARIEVSEDFNPALLRAVVAALATPSC